MAYVMKSLQFKEKLIQALNGKSLYVLGAFGAPATASNKNRYSTNCSYNKDRAKMIQSATADTFFFDCAGLIKGILWGWNANTSKVYGGAVYKSNGVPDTGNLIGYCSNVSSDFTKIQPMEMVYMEGHVGVYIGYGQVIECSPKWENKVQITMLGNLPQYKTGNYRIWLKHGFLPWIDYSDQKETAPVEPKAEDAPKLITNPIEYYTVQKGDSLSKIANKFKTNVNQLVLWNKKKYPTLAINKNLILKGWTLRVK